MRTNADNPDPEDRVKAAGVSRLSDDRPWQPGEPAILDGEHEVKILRDLGSPGQSGYWEVSTPPTHNNTVASVPVHERRLSRPPLAVAAEPAVSGADFVRVNLVARIEALEALAKVQDQRIERTEGHIENLNATSAAVLGQLKVIEDDLPIVVSQLRKRLDALETRLVPSEATVGIAERLVKLEKDCRTSVATITLFSSAFGVVVKRHARVELGLDALEARPVPSEATVGIAERLGDVEQVAASLIDRVKTLELERFAKQPPAAGEPETIAPLPCPFLHDRVGEIYLETHSTSETSYCFYQCSECSMEGPIGYTPEEALAAWNRRA